MSYGASETYKRRTKKRCWNRTGRAALTGLVGLVLMMGLLTTRRTLADGVRPTTEWINIYSLASTWQGQPLPKGSVVAVFRSDGVKCGEVAVHVSGWYGLLPCYREPGPEEGPGSSWMAGADRAAGDGALAFTVDGQQANAVPVSLNGYPVPPSTSVTWTANGDIWQVDLRGGGSDDDLTPVGGYTMPSTVPPVRQQYRPARLVLGAAAVLSGLSIGVLVRKRRTAP